MQVFWETVASNALMVAVLAAGVALLGRVWKNPVGLHLLWVFVLLKLRHAAGADGYRSLGCCSAGNQFG